MKRNPSWGYCREGYYSFLKNTTEEFSTIIIYKQTVLTNQKERQKEMKNMQWKRKLSIVVKPDIPFSAIGLWRCFLICKKMENLRGGKHEKEKKKLKRKPGWRYCRDGRLIFVSLRNKSHAFHFHCAPSLPPPSLPCSPLPCSEV